jgi:lipopolysaccharide transport system ATP-binding protein
MTAQAETNSEAADTSGPVQAAAGGISQNGEPPAVSPDAFWPAPGAFLDLSQLEQTSEGIARCSGVAVCNAAGQPCLVFEQGETVSFFFEFEVLRDMEVPIGGLVLKDAKDVIVHGQNTLAYAGKVPSRVSAGNRVRFRRDVTLGLKIGTYTFEARLSGISAADHATRDSIPHADLSAKIEPLCHVTTAAQFAIRPRDRGTPIRLLHHGIAYLPGAFSVGLVRGLTDGSSPLATAPPPGRADAPAAISTQPTIFHITHWKAGSQWIHRILRECTPDLIVEPYVHEAQFLLQPLLAGKVYPTVYVNKRQWDRVRLPPNWRRFVVIRDLRDTLVSGYFSFMVSHPLLGPYLVQLRQTLLSLDREAGMLHLLEHWLGSSAAIQLSWLEAGEPLIRYEDLLQNDTEILQRVLIEQCQLPVSPERLGEVIASSRFEKVTKGRARGVEDVAAHERKGVSGDWRNHFTDRLKAAFKARYAGLLVATGYEKDLDW